MAHMGFRVTNRVILGLYGGSIGIVEKTMEATI